MKVGDFPGIPPYLLGDIALFINGEQYLLPGNELTTAKLLTEQRQLDEQQCRHFLALPERLGLLVHLINLGYWHFTE